MNYLDHSILSAIRFGGRPEIYTPIHKFIDSSKLYFHHYGHRMLLHNSYGAKAAISIFGDNIHNGEKLVSVRDIVFSHCEEDNISVKQMDVGFLLRNLTFNFFKKETLLRLEKDLKGHVAYHHIFEPYFMTGNLNALCLTVSDLGHSILAQTIRASDLISLPDSYYKFSVSVNEIMTGYFDLSKAIVPNTKQSLIKQVNEYRSK